jgi:iron(III) transport system ATP-binding protein
VSFLRLRSVRKSFGAVLAIDDIDLELAQGSHTAVVGPSASGKSTLLRVIAGFEEPDAGEVTLGGDVLADGRVMIPAHRRGIGYVAQDGALFPHLSVADNIAFGLSRRDPDRAAHVARLMDMVGLDPSTGARRPDQLSGGQQQRVAVARALAQRPRLMLLDEPFSALDTSLRTATRKAITEVLRAANITTILVTHDQAEALSFANHVAVLQGSRLVQFGTPRDLYQRPDTPSIAAYLGDAILLSANIADGWADCAIGHVPVNAADRSGPAQIMLRPEQLRLIEVDAQDDAASCHGDVVDIDFGGDVSRVSVQLRHARDTPSATPLIVKYSGPSWLSVGQRVRVSVVGKAHVFKGDVFKSERLSTTMP